MSWRQAVAGAARMTRSASASAASGVAAATSIDALLRRAATARSPDGDQAAILQAAVAGLRADGARDRAADQPEPEEPELHGREYRSRGPTAMVASLAAVCPAVDARRRTATRRSSDAALGRRRGRRGRASVLPRSSSTGGGRGGPGSSIGLTRRSCDPPLGLAPVDRVRYAPQRGQRRSSAKSDSSGATV